MNSVYFDDYSEAYNVLTYRYVLISACMCIIYDYLVLVHVYMSHSDIYTSHYKFIYQFCYYYYRNMYVYKDLVN